VGWKIYPETGKKRSPKDQSSEKNVIFTNRKVCDHQLLNKKRKKRGGKRDQKNRTKKEPKR